VTARKLTLGIAGVVLLAFLLALPQAFTTRYMINAMIATGMWIVFALAFDLSAGHVGTVSLGHATFFGVGAYVTALVAPDYNLDYIGSTLLSAGSMGVLAFFAGIAFFRIAEVSFAIGTLGALIVAQQLTNNSFDITGGPMCTQGVPRPSIDLPFGIDAIQISSPASYYYLLMPLVGITILIYFLLGTGRVGRAFSAIREDEVRASAMGIRPLRYKLLAFTVGGALIGALGSYQAQYITVVCPSELALTFTISLLIIVFVGGAGSMRGVIVGAVLFNVVPRVLENAAGGEIPPTYQQVAYGLILVIVITYMPDGLEGVMKRIGKRFAMGDADG
jgi:ABC-type branched-subunit amino acid transport system permease subunit